MCRDVCGRAQGAWNGVAIQSDGIRLCAHAALQRRRHRPLVGWQPHASWWWPQSSEAVCIHGEYPALHVPTPATPNHLVVDGCGSPIPTRPWESKLADTRRRSCRTWRTFLPRFAQYAGGSLPGLVRGWSDASVERGGTTTIRTSHFALPGRDRTGKVARSSVGWARDRLSRKPSYYSTCRGEICRVDWRPDRERGYEVESASCHALPDLS